MENNIYFLTQSEMETLKKVIYLLQEAPDKAVDLSKTINDGEVSYAFITGYLGAIMKEASGALKDVIQASTLKGGGK